MTKRTLTILTALLMLALLLVGCSTAAPEEPAPAEPEAAEETTDETTVAFTGQVERETTFTESELKAMETIDVEDTNNNGETVTRTGVPINSLLDMVGVNEDATTLVIVSDEGEEVEVDFAEVRACTQCILAFRTRGGFRSTLPGFPGSVQVRGVIEIRVQ